MKRQSRMILLLLTIALLLTACAFGKTEETVPPTEATAVPTEAPTEASTEAPTEPAEPEGYHLVDTVMPEADAATGTLKFYIAGKEIYAGGPVSNILDLGVTSFDDFDQILQPWHMSGALRVRVELADTKEEDKPFVFFVAMNASEEPKKISECLVYSITINSEAGIEFGSGKESEHFVTRQTELEELIAAYGEPDYNMSRDGNYREIAYYEPFNCAYFSFQKDKVRQVSTYYSANVFGYLAEKLDYKFTDSYFGNDCYILMNQYMDVLPYLNGSAGEDPHILEKLTESITMGGEEIVLGMRCYEMPELFGQHFWDQMMPIHDMRYLRSGRNNEEEFYFLNLDGQPEYLANNLVIKGVFTENLHYVNWGWDKSDFHEFQYENLTQDSTIEEILEQYGMPLDLHCTSNARNCFAWLFYEDQAGNQLEICVDPILNQIVELRVFKYYKGEIQY